jgi:hypothetical protein
MRRMAAVLVLLVALSLAIASPSGAQTATAIVDEAARALRSDPVFVHPDAESKISAAEAARIREHIRSSGAGRVYVAILPASAGPPEQVARELRKRLGRGTYAVITGNSFLGASTEMHVRDLADQAVASKGPQGAGAIVLDFIDRVGERHRSGITTPPGGAAQRSGREPMSDANNTSGAIGLALAALVLVGGVAVLVVVRRRNRAAQNAQLEEVKNVARDDLVALGDDIRALDLDVEMPDADPAAKRFYGQAVDAYTRAEEAFDRARRPDDLEQVTRPLEEGRYAMTAAKARFAGEPVPERRPPCFFDPRHGPSVTEAEWAPPGGTPRPVPVCAADAQRIEDGLPPMTRQIEVEGERMPYWNAPRYYGGWQGGFFGGFGGAFLPGILVGSMFAPEWGGGAEAHADSWDSGGGDLGGGGDFGGGDF